MHVGNRRQAHFQALVGVVELLACGRLVGLRGAVGLDGHQRVEVGRGGAHDQLVIGRFQLQVRRTADMALGAQVGEPAPVKQHLAGTDAVVAAGAGGAAADAVQLGAGTAERGLAIDLRQQGRTGLYRTFAAVQTIRLCRRQLRVAVAGHVIDLQQVGGLGRQRGQCGSQGNGKAVADHRFILCDGVCFRGRTARPARHRAGSRFRFQTAS